MRESHHAHSSSPELSSPPSGNFSPPHLVATAEDLGSRLENGLNVSLIDAGHEKTAKRSAVRDSAAPKRPRKKKESDSNNALLTQHGEEIKPKKPRIPRGTGPRAMRKKAEKAELEAKRAAEEAERQAAQQHSKSQPGFVRPAPPPNNPNNSFQVPAPPQSGNREAIPTSYTQSLAAHNPQPRPLSGQNYDPIRSSTLASGPNSPMHAANTPTKPSAAINAARSPSISSLVDPPDSTRSYTSYLQPSKRDTDFKPASPRHLTKSRLSPPSIRTTLPDSKSPPSHIVDNAISSTHAPEVIGPNSVLPLAPPKAGTVPSKPSMNGTKGPSSGSHSPKSAPRKDAVPLPTAGSGLLSGAMFGGANGAESPAGEKSAPTVIIHVQLKGDNNTINFTKLAEAKYGFNALHPRLAAQKDRLARVAAAGAALENANRAPLGGQSADDMSVDLSNDEGDNSNIEMGGIDDRNGFGPKSGEDTGEAPKRRKRIMKEDMYDKDDEFIDDAEQIWEEQAAVSKDGFFVYSGPLVPEGEEAKVERYESNPPGILSQSSRLTNYRAEANPPKRGGRGGGRGGRGGGAGRGRASKDNKDGKPVVKRVRRSRSQIERDARDEAQRKAKKDSLTLLASKPATTLPSQPMGGPMQHQQQMTT